MKKLLLGLLFLTTTGFAEPIAQFTDKDGTQITLYDEPCTLPAIANLPTRATWISRNEKFESCFGVFGGSIVGAYFDDKSVAVLPAGIFKRMQSL